MQVQFLIDKKSAGADHVVGWTVLKPGARHENHRHHNCDEFFIVLKGHGHIYTDEGEKPSGEGDVVYSPRGCWHGFNNTSNEDVVLVWGWMGAGSIEDFRLRGASGEPQMTAYYIGQHEHRRPRRRFADYLERRRFRSSKSTAAATSPKPARTKCWKASGRPAWSSSNSPDKAGDQGLVQRPRLSSR